MSATALSLPLPRPRRRTTVTPLDPVASLRTLMHAAAELDLDDTDGWDRLRPAAAGTVDALVEAGSLPSHLVVGPADPPAVVARVLVTAWQLVTAPADRHALRY